ncbi:phosphonate C-P lyase system protein PhnH [Bosea sp. MMO-172]|uniref:phosphonate C-P lyase system protein PhnH n=1 Tax=Bosea sp. MMO-172 TaxID=3127885 RepID=UPI003018FFEE
MPAETMIAPGFSDPVFQSQAAFRALLAALSEPGTLQQVASEITPPEGLATATATALLTLADYETPVWLPEALRNGPAGAWLRFHCGAALVGNPVEAAFAVIDGAADEPKLSAFNLGTDQFPDRSTTVIVQVAGLEGGAAIALAGPGIPGTRTVTPRSFRPGFTEELRENGAIYPLGVDVLLACGDGMIGLPRSTQVEEAR